MLWHPQELVLSQVSALAPVVVEVVAPAVEAGLALVVMVAALKFPPTEEATEEELVLVVVLDLLVMEELLPDTVVTELLMLEELSVAATEDLWQAAELPQEVELYRGDIKLPLEVGVTSKNVLKKVANNPHPKGTAGRGIIHYVFFTTFFCLIVDTPIVR